MPHFDGSESVVHVTFHLADSMPKDALQGMEQALSHIPEGERKVERWKQIESWIDAGHGSCVLRHAAMAEMVQDSLRYFDRDRYMLIAWAIMPNHVHVLFEAIQGWNHSKIIASWKSFTGRRISAFMSSQLSMSQTPDGSDRIWHREYWDRYMRHELHFQKTLEYIHQNPVKAGLVARAEDWPWSSARFPKTDYIPAWRRPEASD